MRAETLIKQLGGRWHSDYGMARCPAHEDHNPSLSIKNGREDRILLHCFAGCDYWRIRNEIAKRFGDVIAEDRVVSAVGPKHSSGKNASLWLTNRIWSETVPIERTHAESYLRARGIAGPLPVTLRFHPSLRYAEGQQLPGMVARVSQIGSRLNALHRTFLDPYAPRKTDRGPAKKMLGTCGGGAVHLRHGKRYLAIAEGIETALSVGMGLDEDAALWSSLSATGMVNLILPEPGAFGKTLLIVTDGDQTGHVAGTRLADRAAAKGWHVEIISAPLGLDFNDLVSGVVHG